MDAQPNPEKKSDVKRRHKYAHKYANTHRMNVIETDRKLKKAEHYSRRQYRSNEDSNETIHKKPTIPTNWSGQFTFKAKEDSCLRYTINEMLHIGKALPDNYIASTLKKEFYWDNPDNELAMNDSNGTDTESPLKKRSQSNGRSNRDVKDGTPEWSQQNEASKYQSNIKLSHQVNGRDKNLIILSNFTGDHSPNIKTDTFSEGKVLNEDMDDIQRWKMKMKQFEKEEEVNAIEKNVSYSNQNGDTNQKPNSSHVDGNAAAHTPLKQSSSKKPVKSRFMDFFTDDQENTISSATSIAEQLNKNNLSTNDTSRPALSSILSPHPTTHSANSYDYDYEAIKFKQTPIDIKDMFASVSQPSNVSNHSEAASPFISHEKQITDDQNENVASSPFCESHQLSQSSQDKKKDKFNARLTSLLAGIKSSSSSSAPSVTTSEVVSDHHSPSILSSIMTSLEVSDQSPNKLHRRLSQSSIHRSSSILPSILPSSKQMSFEKDLDLK